MVQGSINGVVGLLLGGLRRWVMTVAEKIRHLPVHREKRKGRKMAEPFEEMDRMMARLFGRPWMHPIEWPLRAAFEGVETPRTDVIDRENEVVIRAEMPGVAKGDVEITLGDDTITLHGTIKEHEEKEGDYYYYRERGQEEFVRTLNLPAAVDGTKAKATYEDGLVHIVLPKLETAKRQKIKITG